MQCLKKYLAFKLINECPNKRCSLDDALTATIPKHPVTCYHTNCKPQSFYRSFLPQLKQSTITQVYIKKRNSDRDSTNFSSSSRWMYQASRSLDVTERTQTECREHSVGVAWYSAVTNQVNHLTTSTQLIHSWSGADCHQSRSCFWWSVNHGSTYCVHLPIRFFQLRQLESIRRSLTTEATYALLQAFIVCRLGYCNSLLAGVAEVYLQHLQPVQNALKISTRVRAMDCSD